VNRLHVVTQERRYDIVTDILSHPEELPTLDELAFMNPPLARSTIQGHLDTLIDAGIVEKRTLDYGERESKSDPRVFFGLTDAGRRLLAEHGLAEEVDLWKELYARVEKPERIRRYETATRP
jgi:DNA-binding transcriptional ArsR family regulator